MNDTCICCWTVISEGHRICPRCSSWGAAPDAFLADGTPLYLKVPTRPVHVSIQLAMYAFLFGKEKNES